MLLILCSELQSSYETNLLSLYTICVYVYYKRSLYDYVIWKWKNKKKKEEIINNSTYVKLVLIIIITRYITPLSA